MLIFARAAKIVGFDFLFTGTKSLDTGSAQLGVLLASALNVPWVTRVSGIDKMQTETVTVTRKRELGYQERVEYTKHLVIAMEAEEDPLDYASFPSVVQAAESPIPCYDLSEIGIPREAVRQAESRLSFGPLRFPAPGLQFIQPPDSSLPAFERRRHIGEGFVKKRQGKIVRGNEDEVVEELFQTLLRGGWLDHHKRDKKK